MKCLHTSSIFEFGMLSILFVTGVVLNISLCRCVLEIVEHESLLGSRVQYAGSLILVFIIGICSDKY